MDFLERENIKKKKKKNNHITHEATKLFKFRNFQLTSARNTTMLLALKLVT